MLVKNLRTAKLTENHADRVIYKTAHMNRCFNNLCCSRHFAAIEPPAVFRYKFLKMTRLSVNKIFTLCDPAICLQGEKIILP